MQCIALAPPCPSCPAYPPVVRRDGPLERRQVPRLDHPAQRRGRQPPAALAAIPAAADPTHGCVYAACCSLLSPCGLCVWMCVAGAWLVRVCDRAVAVGGPRDAPRSIRRQHRVQAGFDRWSRVRAAVHHLPPAAARLPIDWIDAADTHVVDFSWSRPTSSSCHLQIPRRQAEHHIMWAVGYTT